MCSSSTTNRYMKNIIIKVNDYIQSKVDVNTMSAKTAYNLCGLMSQARTTDEIMNIAINYKNANTNYFRYTSSVRLLVQQIT